MNRATYETHTVQAGNTLTRAGQVVGNVCAGGTWRSRLTWPLSRHASLQPAAETYVLIHTPAGFDAFGARVCIREARAAGEPRGRRINIINFDSAEAKAAQSAVGFLKDPLQEEYIPVKRRSVDKRQKVTLRLRSCLSVFNY